MGNTYFLTGYPGFIASELIKEIVRTQEVAHVYVLVLPDMKAKAEDALDGLSLSRHNYTIVEGDITKEALGFNPELTHNLQREITHVYHLAAVYDLAVKKKVARRINVDGTFHVNQFVEGISHLERYTYFSTAYVSGKREGNVLETELVREQGFKNHYERTKYDAEVLVEEVRKQVPTTIIRPGIVRGDSKTGETAKFDGVYFYLNILERFRQLRMPRIPLLAEGEAEGNFVPVDYVIRATVYLSHHGVGVGKTYHLTDPAPYTMEQVYVMLSEAYLGKTPKRGLLSKLAGNSLSRPLEKYFTVEKEALAYSSVNAHYDTSHAERDLEDSGITCPDFNETINSLVAYYKKHRKDKNKHVKV